MSTRIEADNLSAINVKQQSLLNVDVAAGATTITLLNASGIVANDWIFVGRQASEQCEMRQASSVTGAVVTLTAALSFGHSKGDSITAAYGNKIRFKSATNVDGTVPAAGSFSNITGGDVDIVADQAVTAFVDTSGGTGLWYLYTFYNSTTTSETDINAGLRGAARGEDYGHYVDLASIRNEAGFRDATYIEDTSIDELRSDAEATVNGKLAKVTTVPFTEPIPRQIVMITRRLAAGWMMLREYGPNTDGNPKSEAGQKMVDWAELQLEGIESGKIMLLDANGTELRRDNSEFSYAPDGTDSYDGPMFTINQIF